MLGELKGELAELDRAAQAAKGRDENLAGMVAGLNRALGALFRVLEEERPGTAARLLAAIDEAARDPGGGLQRAGDGENGVDARVHPGVSGGHRQVHEPQNRPGEVVAGRFRTTRRP